MREAVLLGLDGGASKTNGMLIDAGGSILAHARGPGSAIIGDPKPESCQVLSSLVEALCAEAGVSRAAITHCGLGLNGIDFADEFPGQHAGLSAALDLPPERLTLVNDGIVALWAASPASASLIVQHGSGFTAACRSDYGREECFDHLHVADTYDLRYGLMAAVGRMILGMIPTTPLKQTVLDFFQVTEQDYCEAIYRDRIPRARRLHTTPLIFAAWQQGDPVAAALVENALADYALLVRAMALRTQSDRPAVVLGGGQLRAAPAAFLDSLTARVREHYPSIVVAAPVLPPEFGAALMAGFHAGLDSAELFALLAESHARWASTPS